MASKIRVYGKAQNRTALGIMHAYLKMYPQATLEDFQKAFPDSLNPDSGVKINFIESKDIATRFTNNWNGFFTEEDCLLHLEDGKKVAVVSMWTKPSFERLVEHAKLYDIEVAKFEAAEKGFGKKGGYRLEYLNGYVPPVREEKKSPKWWIWGLIGAIVLIVLLILLLGKGKNEPEVVTVIKKDTVTIIKTDTVYIQQVQDIERKFNDAKFAKDSYELNDDAKFALYELSKLLNEKQEIKLKIVGHTSTEGDPVYNQKLSENRAKAAVNFLISKGIDKSRVNYEGKGGSEPIDPNNHEINRRTEFIIIK